MNQRLNRIKGILAAEAKAISSVEIDDRYDQAIELMKTCEGKLIITGIGKAGFIAKKFAATLCSTGTPAVYIHPAEAAHGDLGVIEKNDLVFAFSTSGKTREVIELIKFSRHLTSGKVIAITSHPESELRDNADLVLDMGIIEEPCYLSLTPSASIAVMSAISDAITLTLMEEKGITRHDYGIRHHGGYLGHKARLDNE
jgi:arabinose-5-phosphate isomerase